MARRKGDSQPGFEQSLKQLEEIVRRLEEEEVPLETSLQLFADGQRLVRACEAQLKAAENQVRQLLENAAGEIEEQAFDATDDRCGELAGEAGEAESEDGALAGEPAEAPPTSPTHPDDDDLPF
ncbi:MAG TPA: exodeoxyribonuclease VII small subunit [Candidatus Sumerlaeota bacterium]|nr:exodeoxyribonuclease VII small subunit [Candidatus Sumerlaeota bacterium]HPK02895.1 exodeoxyribonuclease VII small subunit [Candidatus Sumerlaeota bacterium]